MEGCLLENDRIQLYIPAYKLNEKKILGLDYFSKTIALVQ